MKIYYYKKDLITCLQPFITERKSIGFIPTMGALHRGHISLIERAALENEVVVVSIFVNPTQFNNADDLAKYPRTLQSDISKIEATCPSVILYAPEADDVYDGMIASEYFDFEGLDRVMEGEFRPGHFQGVATVVKRLFEIVRPNRAYFGEKDYQQLLIIHKMVQQVRLDVDIIPCPIIRSKSGLALSSRNARLSKKAIKQAAEIYQILSHARQLFSELEPNEVSKWVENEFANRKYFELEYFTIANSETLQPIDEKKEKQTYRAFVAVYIENVRLIDNVEF